MNINFHTNTTTSGLISWGEQFLNSLIEKGTDQLVQCLLSWGIRQLKEFFCWIRRPRKRVEQFMLLVALLGALLVPWANFAYDSIYMEQCAEINSEEDLNKNIRNYYQEVFSCLPVQRCTENNSVNSAKICWERPSHKPKATRESAASYCTSLCGFSHQDIRLTWKSPNRFSPRNPRRTVSFLLYQLC